MHRKAFLALVVVCCLAVPAFAVPTITAGVHALLPNTPGQVIPILVSGGVGDDFAGVDLALSIDGSVGPAPVMSAVDIIGAGTVFDGNNTGQGDFLPYPTLDQVSLTTTAAGTVGPNGTLAFVTIDTTGFNSGSWSLGLISQFIGIPSDLPPFDGIGQPLPTLIDGSISIVPEPGSIVLALFAAGGLCAVAIRRRRKNA